MMYWNGHMSGWGYLAMGLSSVVFWALLIGGGILLYRELASRRPPSTPDSSPERLLADRYARGEIDDDEYRRRLDTLRHAGPARHA
jgi:putative membrane protein